MSFCCPACGTPLAERPSPHAIVRGAPLAGLELKIAHALLPEFGQWVSQMRLVNRVFGIRPKDTLKKNKQSLSAALLLTKRILVARGLTIENTRYPKPLYRLTWLIEEPAPTPEQVAW